LLGSSLRPIQCFENGIAQYAVAEFACFVGGPPLRSKLWKVATGQVLYDFVSGSLDKTLKLWDAANGRLEYCVCQHSVPERTLSE